jgi:hypothetical protein
LRKVLKCIKFVKGYLWDIQFQGKFLDRDFVEKTWYQHIEEVKAAVPKEKLLVYNVKDGWGPLCEFLGVPEPEQEFPHLNKGENFRGMMQKILKGISA